MCPPGVDQTLRSAQTWSILAPEKCQGLRFQPKRWSPDPILDTFDTEFLKNVWYMVARPAHARPPGSGIPLRNTTVQRSGYLSLLSNEVFDMVLSHLESKQDIISLGLASRSLWHQVLHHIQASYLAAAAPWADTRLLFQGSYSQDLPEVLTGDGDLVENLISAPRRRSIARGDARILYHTVVACGSPPTVLDLIDALSKTMRTYRESSSISDRVWAVLFDDIEYPKHEKGNNQWVLRNLTTREVVFSEVCSGSLEKEDLEFILESILMKQIRWTSMLGYYKKNVSPYRGVWAGHRLDIVTESIHEEQSGEWKDVSGAMMKAYLAISKRQGNRDDNDDLEDSEDEEDLE